MYFQTGQMIFVPEWPKGEFVSILASFCVWTKSLMCKDAVNRDFTIQSDVRRFCLQVRRIQVPCQPSGRSSHPVRTPFCPLFHPSRRRTPSVRMPDRSASFVWTKCSFHPDPDTVSKRFYQLASVRTFQQHVRTPLYFRTVF
jgi:hypothetical protein